MSRWRNHGVRANIHGTLHLQSARVHVGSRRFLPCAGQHLCVHGHAREFQHACMRFPRHSPGACARARLSGPHMHLPLGAPLLFASRGRALSGGAERRGRRRASGAFSPPPPCPRVAGPAPQARCPLRRPGNTRLPRRASSRGTRAVSSWLSASAHRCQRLSASLRVAENVAGIFPSLGVEFATSAHRRDVYHHSDPHPMSASSQRRQVGPVFSARR